MRYDSGPTPEGYPFVFATPDAPELRELRERYGLEALVKDSGSDLEKVRRICAWVRSLWEHDGLNEPSSPDALTILEEASQGKSFRCVEYGIVISACAAALGLPSRVLQVKTEDSETREYGASHVVSEIFLADLGRWVLADGQWNIVPLCEDRALNALELRLAMDEDASLTTFSSASDETMREYLSWIDEYLFCFVTWLDTRQVELFAGKKLALLPLGAKEPTVFQQRFPVTDTTYTRFAKAFYPNPVHANPDP